MTEVCGCGFKNYSILFYVTTCLPSSSASAGVTGGQGVGVAGGG